MSGKLGILFTRAGHDVVFSYARSDQKLKRSAREANGHARAGTPAEAVSDGDGHQRGVLWGVRGQTKGTEHGLTAATTPPRSKSRRR